MKLITTVAALALVLPAAAHAQETRVEERVVVMAGPGGPMDIGDAGLTREAFMARHVEMFDRMDADHNGVVTREEMAAMHAMMGPMGGPGMDGPGHGAMVFHGDNGEQVVLDDNGEWTSQDGSRRIVVRRRGPDGADMSMAGETIDIEGPPGDGGGRRIVIMRHGPGDGPMEMGPDHAMHGGPGPEGGERRVMIFRSEGANGLDADGDGRWTFEEMAAPIREHFNQLDTDHDGYVDASERGG